MTDNRPSTIQNLSNLSIVKSLNFYHSSLLQPQTLFALIGKIPSETRLWYSVGTAISPSSHLPQIPSSQKMKEKNYSQHTKTIFTTLFIR